MNKWRRMLSMSFGAQISAGFAVVIAVLLAAGAISAVLALSIHGKTQRLVGEGAELAKLAQEWRTVILLNTTRWTAIANSSDPTVLIYFSKSIESTNIESKKIADRIAQLDQTTKGKEILQKINTAYSKWITARDKLREAKDRGADGLAMSIANNEFDPGTKALLAAAEEYAQYQRTISDAVGTEVAGSITKLITSLGVAALLSLVVSVLIAWRLSRAISSPMKNAVEFAQRVAAGDLTCKVEIHGRDEASQVLEAMLKMQSSLAEVVSRVKVGMDKVASASEEIASGNADLSLRTEQAASSLEETAASMEEFTSSIQANAESAKDANRLVGNAYETAARGGEVVGQVVSTMGEIEASSKKINDIIGVIDGIAFQTNILALNAAVEAARAGEQGRGFAVVASEVRNLAQRSASAAKEIKGLIQESVSKVGEGSRLVGDAGETMADIVRSVQSVTDIMNRISSASAEQSSGISQVNQAIAQMDQMTQKNAALVEQSAAAADGMHEEARHLRQMVDKFRLN